MFKFLLTLGLLLLVNNLALAQNQPELCTQSQSLDFNATQLSGIWWEVARYPSDSKLACTKVNFTVDSTDNVLQIATTYAVSTTYLWVNQTMYANISLANPSSSGYNISYIDGITTTAYTVYKLLQTNYTDYALFCGYTNSTNNATSFGIILTRERYPNRTTILDLQSSVATQYADFSYGNIPSVQQTPVCYAAGAVTQYSIYVTIFALLYAILNIFI